MKQSSSTANAAADAAADAATDAAAVNSDDKAETRGRKPLGGAPRQSQSFNLTDYELAHLNECDPSGKGNRAAGLRALIAASMARKAATLAQPVTEGASRIIA